jgi:adenylate cyclase
MPKGSVPPRPENAQIGQDEWDRFYAFFAHARIRRVVRLVSKLPSPPRCEACGNPFGGISGWLMRRVRKGPSRKNPRWCNICFEAAPQGGITMTIGVLFADVRGYTAHSEHSDPEKIAAEMTRFYGDLTRVIVQHRIVDKFMGDAVMGPYFPALSKDVRSVDSMVSDAQRILAKVGYGSTDGPRLEVGIGLAIGPAFVGIVREGEVNDFTAKARVLTVAR